MHAPVMLRDFIEQYQANRITATKWESPTSKFSMFIKFLNRHASMHSGNLNSVHNPCNNLYCYWTV